MITRRGFIGLLGVGAAAAVAPALVLPEPALIEEPRRRIWQVGRNAPVRSLYDGEALFTPNMTATLTHESLLRAMAEVKRYADPLVFDVDSMRDFFRRESDAAFDAGRYLYCSPRIVYPKSIQWPLTYPVTTEDA